MDKLERVKSILKKAIAGRSSDLHLMANMEPIVRVDDKLHKVEGEKVLASEEVEALILTTLRPEHTEKLKSDKETDYSFNFDGA
ncbi:MAG: hypothetical protein OEV37_01100, partial [Candidatus Berkelbacteria bacterium]|nr:hypothetical protein [Candidatus Berkelbacteria bacterium]